MFKDVPVRTEDVSGHLYVTVLLSPQLTKSTGICGQQPTRASQQRWHKQIAKGTWRKKKAATRKYSIVNVIQIVKKQETKFHWTCLQFKEASYSYQLQLRNQSPLSAIEQTDLCMYIRASEKQLHKGVELKK